MQWPLLAALAGSECDIRRGNLCCVAAATARATTESHAATEFTALVTTSKPSTIHPVPGLVAVRRDPATEPATATNSVAATTSKHGLLWRLFLDGENRGLLLLEHISVLLRLLLQLRLDLERNMRSLQRL